MAENILDIEKKQAEKKLNILRLTPENTEFYETKGGLLGVKINGEDTPYVNVICSFPLTDPEKYLSIRLPDGKQEELGMIENLSDFDLKTVEILKKQLKLRYYMPKITRIISVKEEYGYTYWTVDTDCGRAKFASSSGSAGAVIHHGKGVIIKDSNENRYFLEDLTKLTPKEMKKLDLYL